MAFRGGVNPKLLIKLIDLTDCDITLRNKPLEMGWRVWGAEHRRGGGKMERS